VPGGAGAPLLRRGHPATLGGDVDYVGEVDHHRKVELLAGARALVNPIRWDEPFSLVMVEALACGTPVVATHHGAAPELVDHGLTGFIAGTVTDLAAAVNTWRPTTPPSTAPSSTPAATPPPAAHTSDPHLAPDPAVPAPT
jgi:glycosyltransferase involved in cell wall biosynthesis